jgi:iron complex transport system substrate-binding protein
MGTGGRRAHEPLPFSRQGFVLLPEGLSKMSFANLEAEDFLYVPRKGGDVTILVQRSLLLMALVVALAVAVACEDGGEEPTPKASPTGPGPVQVQASYPLTIVDSVGREVAIEAQPQRIASLSPAATEILFAIGAGDQVIAVDNYSNYPEEAATRQQLDAYEPNLEAIAGVRPDLVLLFYDPGELADSLERLGITTAVLGSVEETPESVEAVFDQIRLLGQMTDHIQEAERLVAEMQDRVDAVEEALADVEQGPRIFHEVDATLYTAAPNSFVGGLYEILKAQNLASGADQPFPQLTQEVIIERDPEVIILADSAYGESADTVKARPGWGSISAVRNDRIFAIDPDIVSRPGPRCVDALDTLAEFLYPERFE